jgi:hypothetical protein
MFPPQALELFIELEAAPQRERDSKAFKDAEHQLANLLGLTAEWWATCSVLDRSERPPWPSHLVAHGYWYKVRAIREALLAAVARLQAAE